MTLLIRLGLFTIASPAATSLYAVDPAGTLSVSGVLRNPLPGASPLTVTRGLSWSQSQGTTASPQDTTVAFAFLG